MGFIEPKRDLTRTEETLKLHAVAEKRMREKSLVQRDGDPSGTNFLRRFCRERASQVSENDWYLVWASLIAGVALRKAAISPYLDSKIALGGTRK